MSPSVPSKHLPLRFQVALALAVAKTKPKDLPVRDYLCRLRQHIHTGRKPISTSDSRYFDAVGYWRNRNKDSQEEILKLQARISTLERNSQSSTDHPLEIPAAKEIKTPRVSKRRPESPMPGLERNSKRQKVPTLTRNNSLDEDLAQLGDAETGPALVNSVWELYRQLQLRSPNSSALAAAVCRTASLLETRICDAALNLHNKVLDIVSGSLNAAPSRSHSHATADTLISKLQQDAVGIRSAAARTISILLSGIAEIVDGEPLALTCEQGSAVHAVAQLSGALLRTVTSAVLVTAQKGIEPFQVGKKAKGKMQQHAQDMVPDAVVSLILSLISHLEPRHKTHTAIFEGILYQILERVGKGLYVLTFGHERKATVEGDIESNEQARFPSSEKAQDPNQAALAMEVIHLVTVLKEAMRLAPSMLGASAVKTVRSTASNRRPTAASRKSGVDVKATLCQQAKEKLQSTLIYCMFGDEHLNQEFFERLRKPMPSIPSSIFAAHDLAEEDVSDWFRGEIWKLIGWDILATENDW